MIQECHTFVRDHARPHKEVLQNTDPSVEEAYQFFAPYGRVFVLGTGGSIMGGQALAPLGHNPSRCVFCHSIDPQAFANTLTEPLHDAGFLIISKSGETSETLMQIKMLDALSPHWHKKARVITDPSTSRLRIWAQSHGIPIDNHAPVGGRYSLFTNVGMTPARLMGVDLEAFRQGAASVFHDLEKTEPDGASALLTGHQNVEWMNAGLNVSVIWVYSEALVPWAMWYKQLWSESLGKRTASGAGVGSTPVVALGTQDQHSQLQLYLDGPYDKNFIFIMIDHTKHTLDHLAPMARLMNAHQQAVGDILSEKGRAVRRVKLPHLNACTLGEWMAYNMLEVWSTAYFLQVDPLTQDAVEELKQRIRNIV